VKGGAGSNVPIAVQNNPGLWREYFGLQIEIEKQLKNKRS
jgi:hypothetical protein